MQRLGRVAKVPHLGGKVRPAGAIKVERKRHFREAEPQSLQRGTVRQVWQPRRECVEVPRLEAPVYLRSKTGTLLQCSSISHWTSHTPAASCRAGLLVPHCTSQPGVVSTPSTKWHLATV